MDIYNILIGILFIIFGTLLMILEMRNRKKPINSFTIQKMGSFLIFIMIGLFLILRELKNIL